MSPDHLSQNIAGIIFQYLSSISKNIGQEPFQAVLQNFLMYPDVLYSDRIRLQLLADMIIETIDKSREMPDPKDVTLVKLYPITSPPIPFVPTQVFLPSTDLKGIQLNTPTEPLEKLTFMEIK